MSEEKPAPDGVFRDDRALTRCPKCGAVTMRGLGCTVECDPLPAPPEEEGEGTTGVGEE